MRVTATVASAQPSVVANVAELSWTDELASELSASFVIKASAAPPPFVLKGKFTSGKSFEFVCPKHTHFRFDQPQLKIPNRGPIHPSMSSTRALSQRNSVSQ